MRFIELRHLRGPNIYTTSPVAVATLELDELAGRETTGFGGFAGRLTALLPGLADHHCSAGRPGGFCDAMARGTYFGHVSEHVMLELSALAGRPVHLGRTMSAGSDGRFDVMTECPADEPATSGVPESLLLLAMQVVQAVLAGGTPDFRAELERIAAVIEAERLGVSTAAIADAARRRGIPVRRAGDTSMLRLGYGCHRRLVCAALTSQTSAVGVDIAADKQLAKQLLAAAGVPVAPGVVARSEDAARAALAALSGPVVIKQLDGSHGALMTIGVQTADEAAAAYRKASAGGHAVLVEELVPGSDYRVLVIGGRIAAAAQLRPASVTGDGEHTVGELVGAANADPRRGAGHALELTKIALDDDAISHLRSSGLDERSVPAAGQVVTLRRNANLSTGGTSRDVTDLVHPEIAAMCRRAAGAAGLDICGIDVRLADIAAPLHDPAGGGLAQPCAVLELNACPGLRMHLAPAAGRPRDVAAAVVDSLYPAGAPARIPVVSVTGTNGKTSTVRMIAAVLRQAGLRAGLSCSDGVEVDGRLVYAADASGPRSAETLLDDPGVEAAVLETARGGIVRRGLGYSAADVGVVTNISADHIGEDGIDDLDQLIDVKSLVAEEVRPGGTVVLNADDAAVAALASRPAVQRRGPVIAMFSLTPGSPVLAAHRAAGLPCYEVTGGQLTETAGGQSRSVLAVADLPGAFGGLAAHVVANALAAVAACRALGVSVADIAAGLAGFRPPADNPGRASFFRAGPVPVVLDYGHNAAAIQATGRFLGELFGTAPAAAVTLPGDRTDDRLAETARAIAAWFGPVVLYEDADKRGRADGEMIALLKAELRAARPDITIRSAVGPADALRAAVELAGCRPVVFLYEKLAYAADALAAVDARPWPEAESLATGRAEAAGSQLAVLPAAALVVPAARGDARAAADAAAAAVLAGLAQATPRDPAERDEPSWHAAAEPSDGSADYEPQPAPRSVS